jgi:glucan-binding YG repeat protein
MSPKKRNKQHPIGGKDGLYFDRPVPKFLQAYMPSATDQVDVEAKREQPASEQVQVHEEIANLKKQGFQVHSESFPEPSTVSPLQESSDKGKQVEKKETSSNDAIPDEEKPTSPPHSSLSRGRNHQSIASIGIKKQPASNSTTKGVSQNKKKLLPHKVAVERQLLSFQEQDE